MTAATKVSAGRRRGELRAKFPAPATSDLQRQRLARGHSLDDLAALSGVARRSIANAEAGQQIAEQSWWSLASALRVPREWIDPTFRENLRVRIGYSELEFGS